MSLDDYQSAVIAANRFGFGAKPGEIRAAEADPKAWLMAQLDNASAVPEAIGSLPGSAVLIGDFHEQRMARRDRHAQPAGDLAEKIKAGLKQHAVPAYMAQVEARTHLAATSPNSFFERLTHFWANHFAVSSDKPQTLALAGALEFEAVRPHVNARFIDMLLAVERHPAMVLYLDNRRSMGVNSRAARFIQGRKRAQGTPGLNENLGREILELHTLGVDGGYIQQDVKALAKALTGWSIGGINPRGQLEPVGTFVFREPMHEPGSRTVLGNRYAEAGETQAVEILEDLARHPSTAKYVSAKLARHFVSEDPPVDVIERMAGVFMETDGHLPSVYLSMVDHPLVWSETRAKFKTPNDFLISAFRLLDFVPREPRILIGSFEHLGQRPWTPGSPAGWPEQAAFWNGADALMKRIEWAAAVGQRIGNRYDPMRLIRQAFGDTIDEHTRLAVSRAESAEQGLSLLLASPEFQWR